MSSPNIVADGDKSSDGKVLDVVFFELLLLDLVFLVLFLKNLDAILEKHSDIPR